MTVIVQPSEDVRTANKTVTFTGAAGLGAVGTVALFTVTGRVFMEAFYGYVTTDLTEAAPTATMTCGVASNTDCLAVDRTGGPAALDANDFWGIAAGTDSPGDIAVTVNAGTNSTQSMRIIAEDIILTIGTQAVDGGVMEFGIRWAPFSAGGLLVPA